MTADDRVKELKSEIARLRNGYGMELMDIEAELANALGYSWESGYGWNTGEHTQVTLAMETRRRVAELEEENRRWQSADSKAVNDALRRITELEAKNTHLRTENVCLQRENDDLREQIEDLEQDNESLREENEDIKERT